MVPNPEYADAPYEMSFTVGGTDVTTGLPRRFRVPVPHSLSDSEFWEWVRLNEVPSHIEQ